MDTVSQFPARSVDVVDEAEPVIRRERSSTLIVTVIYHLSEEGRKASLLAGGDGRAVQEIKVQVPTNRFHLVSVDAEGLARLELQPRFYLDAAQNVIRSDTPPTYDAPPSVDDLLKEAARNHQLERAYHVELAESRRKRQDRVFETHEQLAERFLADPTLRAHEHPKPTPRRCYLTHRHRTIMFDTKTDRGLARQVPPEAHRRFCKVVITKADFLVTSANAEHANEGQWATETGARKPAPMRHSPCASTGWRGRKIPRRPP